MRRSSGPALALVLLVVLTGSACGEDDLDLSAPATTTSTEAPPTTADYEANFPDGVNHVVARARESSIGVFDSPVQPEAPRRLANPRPSGADLVFLVNEFQGDWVNVLVPFRPNGRSGWVRRSDVELSTHPYRIEVSMAAHTLTVWKGTEVFHSEPVGVGRGTTPTPGGRFYTVELYRSNKAAYGPFAYGLSGFSEVFYDFGGGDGQFGIHGTNDPSGLGRDVSNGCIRMSNAGITKLANELPIGVPVEIKA